MNSPKPQERAAADGMTLADTGDDLGDLAAFTLGAEDLKEVTLHSRVDAWMIEQAAQETADRESERARAASSPPAKRGRKSCASERAKLMREYDAGLEAGDWLSRAEFARKTQRDELLTRNQLRMAEKEAAKRDEAR
jgi:hypothetical protein